MKLEAERFFKQEMRNLSRRRADVKEDKSLWEEAGTISRVIQSYHSSPNTFPSNVTSHDKRSSNQSETPQSFRSERHPLSFLDKHIVVFSQRRCFLTTSSQHLQHLWTLKSTRSQNWRHSCSLIGKIFLIDFTLSQKNWLNVQFFVLFCPVAVLLRKYFSFSSFFAATQKSKATDTNDDKNLNNNAHTHLHTCGEKPGPLKTLLLDSSHLGEPVLFKLSGKQHTEPDRKIYRFVHFETFG